MLLPLTVTAGEDQTWEQLTGQKVQEFTPRPPQVTSRGDEWTGGNTGLEIAWAVLWVADWSQTLHISRNPDQYYEKVCIFLKDHPSSGDVNTYFATSLILHPLISFALPQPYRLAWQGVTIVNEVDMVNNNYKIGISLGF